MNEQDVRALLAELEAENLDKNAEFIKEELKVRIIEDILLAMEEENISRAEIAKRTGKSKQYISRVLNEHVNFTLDSLVDFALALGRSISVKFVKNEQVINSKDDYESAVSAVQYSCVREIYPAVA